MTNIDFKGDFGFVFISESYMFRIMKDVGIGKH